MLEVVYICDIHDRNSIEASSTAVHLFPALRSVMSVMKGIPILQEWQTLCTQASDFVFLESQLINTSQHTTAWDSIELPKTIKTPKHRGASGALLFSPAALDLLSATSHGQREDAPGMQRF